MPKRIENIHGRTPAGWDVVSLGDCFSLSSGNVKPDDVIPFGHPNHDVPVYGGNGITGYSRECLVDGELLVLGRVGEYCGCTHYVNGRCWVTDNALFTRNLKRHDSVRFYAYLLQYINLNRYRNKGGQPLISQRLVNIKKVALPPLPEQKKIAAILGTWDEAIEKIERLIEAKKRLKKGLMQQLLTGKRRFKEFEGQAWKNHEFGDICSLSKRKYDPKKGKHDLQCVELEHISQDLGTILGSTQSQTQSCTKSVFSKGHVLFGKLRPYLRKYYFAEFDGVCSTEIWVLAARPSRCLPRYLYYLVQTETFMQAANITSGTKMPRSDWEVVSSTLFRIPSISEQSSITRMLDGYETEIRVLRSMHDLIGQQKKGLMQKLLTGQIRVKV